MIARYVVGALSFAMLLVLWRLDHVSTELTQAEADLGTLSNEADSRRNTQRLLAQLDTEHTRELSNAQAQNAALRARIGTGAQRLSVNASCPVRTATSPARMDDDQARAELNAAPAERIVTIANDGDDAVRALSGLQDYVDTVCLPRK